MLHTGTPEFTGGAYWSGWAKPAHFSGFVGYVCSLSAHILTFARPLFCSFRLQCLSLTYFRDLKTDVLFLMYQQAFYICYYYTRDYGRRCVISKRTFWCSRNTIECFVKSTTSEFWWICCSYMADVVTDAGIHLYVLLLSGRTCRVMYLVALSI